MHAQGNRGEGRRRIVTTVMYHYVRDIPDTSGRRFKGIRPEQFEGQLDYVTRHYTVCRLADVIAAAHGELELPPRPCVLTFDDGLREHYGVRDEDQESWIVHIEGDAGHSETAFKVVLDACTTAELQRDMLWCIDQYTGHWANFWRACETGKVARRPS